MHGNWERVHSAERPAKEKPGGKLKKQIDDFERTEYERTRGL